MWQGLYFDIKELVPGLVCLFLTRMKMLKQLSRQQPALLPVLQELLVPSFLSTYGKTNICEAVSLTNCSALEILKHVF